jgi:hypothetical protein
MKKLILSLAACVGVVANSNAQGFVEFRNYSPDFSALDAAIYVDQVSPSHPSGGTRAPDSTVASLFWGTQGSSLNQLVAAVNSANANPITANLGAVGPGSGWFNGGFFGINGTTPGTAYTFAVYGSNSSLGKDGWSNTFDLTVLGGTDPNIPLLSGMQAFAITTIPEPSTVILGVMGGLALLLRRRK